MNAEWRFDANDYQSLRAVRGAALELLREHAEASSDFDACAVVLSELMSNAALHGPPGTIHVGIDWSTEVPVVSVRDGGRGFSPAIALPPPNHEGGRGLYLIERLASTPSVSVDERGCSVSVRLPLRRS